MSKLDGTTPSTLHGTARRGHDGRIGLEDASVLPDGAVAADNVDLITAARWISD